MSTFLTLELLFGVVALVWGAVVLSPAESFAAVRFAAFSVEREAVWGLYFLALGVAVLFTALTRSRPSRFVVDVVACFSFAQLVWRLAQSPEPPVPATYVYAFVGVALPLVCVLWHALVMVIDDIASIPADIRQAWLDE